MTYALLGIFAVFWLFVLWRFYQAAERFSERNFRRVLEIRQSKDT